MTEAEANLKLQLTLLPHSLNLALLEQSGFSIIDRETEVEYWSGIVDRRQGTVRMDR
jgi:hypothetical protein